MHLVRLRDHLNLVKTVAKWWFDEWSHLSSHASSIEDTIAGLYKKMADRPSLPIIIVAILDDEAVGTAALKLQELRDHFPETQHWLGNVYVKPEARGLGSALVREIETIAATQNIPALHLATEQLNGGLYARLGWEAVTQIADRGDDVLVMRKDVSTSATTPLNPSVTATKDIAMDSHSKLQITTFQPDEWGLYRETRLKALADAPWAFCQSLADAQQIPDQEWQARLVCDRPDSLHLPIKALWKDEIAGMAWGRINKADPQTAHLFQMWVDSSFRRLGIGKSIIWFFLNWAKENATSQAKLGVTCGHDAPYQLYQSFGFQPDGEPELMRDGSAEQFQNMVLVLS